MKPCLRILILLLIITVPLNIIAADPEVDPWNDVLDEEFEIPEGETVEMEEVAPLSPYTAAALQAPTPSVSFQGLGDDNRRIPPDTYGAVGPSHVMTMINTQVRIQDRTGLTNYLTMRTLDWWTNAGSLTRAPDPRVVYDPYGQRWIAAAIGDPDGPVSCVLLAVSQTSDPTGSWYYKKIDVDTNNIVWADYTMLGFNKNWIALSVNMSTNSSLCSSNCLSGSRIYIFDKQNAYTNGSSYTIQNLPYPTWRESVVPAITMDNTTSELYCFEAITGRYHVGNGVYWGMMRLSKISGPVASPVFSVVKLIYTTKNWAAKPGANVNFAPQTNSTVKISANDHRMQSVVYRAGWIYGVHTVFLPATSPTRSSIMWWRMLANGTSASASLIDDSSGANFFAYPSLAVNKFNDVLIGYSSFSSTQYASASYSFRAYTDPTGTTRPRQLLKAGESVYWKTGATDPRNRWGDYSATVVDPVNDADFWTVQEYASTNVGSITNNGSGRFGVWWGKVTVSVPANDAFANAVTLSGAIGTNTANVYRGTRETSEPTHAGVTTSSTTWFNWTAPTNGFVAFDTLRSPLDWDTVLAVYTGSAVGSLTPVAFNDDAKIPSGQTTIKVKTSQLSFLAAGGTTYRIAVCSKSEIVDPVSLYWIQPQAPHFVIEPDNKYLLAGDPLVLESLAIGTPTPTFQWQSNAVNLSGATYANYTNSNPQPQTTNGPTTFEYLITATNSAGAAHSRTSYVTIYPTATATHDGFELLSGDKLKFTVNGISNYLYNVQATSDFITQPSHDRKNSTENPLIYWAFGVRIRFCV